MTRSAMTGLMVAGALLALAVGGPAGCGGSSADEPQTDTAGPRCTGACTCTGSACSCSEGSTCSLGSGADAGPPNNVVFRCDSKANCDMSCGVGCTTTCGGQSTCTGSCGDSCTTSCGGGSTCNLTTGTNSTITCDGNTTCNLDAGSGTKASCTGNSGCNVTCPAGNCVVECQGSGQCSLACALPLPSGADAGAPTACTLNCGSGKNPTMICQPGSTCACGK